MYVGNYGAGQSNNIAVKRIYDKDIFEHEANILSQLKHDSIVRYIGDCTFQSQYFIITELVLDGNLRDYLDRNPAEPLPKDIIWTICHQLASALNHMHHHQIPIIHRSHDAMHI